MCFLYLLLLHQWVEVGGLFLVSVWEVGVLFLTVTFNHVDGSFNCLAPKGCSSNFKTINSKLILQNSSHRFCCEYDLSWRQQNLTNETLIRVQTMATSHYLSQCCASYISPYGVTRLQWVNFFKCHHQGSLNNPIFSNLGLCAACWAHFMCHHEL